MEGLVKLQSALQKTIENGFTNFNKTPKARLTLEYVEVRTDILDKNWSEFCNNNRSIIELSTPKDQTENLYFVNDIYSVVEEKYLEYRTVLKSSQNKFTALQKSTFSNTTDTTKAPSLVRLPKISIPTFSGKYSEWTSFRDLFLSLVHKNDSLDSVQKLHYLKSHLTGEAEQLVRYIPITEDNYVQCWEQLEGRYNNKKYLANCILRRFFGQKRVFVESANSLKEILDTTMDCMNAFKNLQIDVSTWDILVIYIVTSKLDPETRKQWEITISSDTSGNLPSFDQFKCFLESRFRALEFIEPKRVTGQHNVSHTNPHSSKVMFTTHQGSTNTSNIKCEYCSHNHKLCFCKKFQDLDLNKRREFVAGNKICFNCLGGNHMVNECQKATFCRTCKKRHHTLLHVDSTSSSSGKGLKVKPSTSVEGASTSHEDVPILSCVSTGEVSKSQQVLLATALITVQSNTGQFQVLRALLDQGSQASFVTEDKVQFLRLKKTRVHGVVSGVGGNKTTVIKYMVTLKLKSLVDSSLEYNIQAYVLNNITSHIPERRIETFKWVDLEQLQLADPEFNKPNKIDVLLGADVYSQIIKDGIKRSPNGRILAQSTTFGWILSGKVTPESINNNIQTHKITVMHVNVEENDMLKRFWEIEDQSYSNKKLLTIEEQRCEEIYAATTTRAVDGRYIVKLPFREDQPRCVSGNSKEIAVKRLLSLERRFSKDIVLKERYGDVIKEYLQLNHMRPVKSEDSKRDKAVYLPHHAVVKEERSTTKVRVVFDGSCKNQDGISLNDELMVGPTLQLDLRHIVMRWRVYPIGIVADVTKMYRQVRVTDEDASFQRIVWRENPGDPIKDFELVTVTFGTASAPYLAVKTLHQVAIDEAKDFPKASGLIPVSFYVDDLMTGSFSVEEGIEVYREIKELLFRGGFDLQKWNSNNIELLDIIHKIEGKNKQNCKNDKDNKKIEIKKEDNNEEQVEGKNLIDVTKILGLTWSRHEDIFKYSVQLKPKTAPETKRSILSDIARLFDPLGWIAPSIIIAKIFIQRLWLSGVGWDEEIPTNLQDEWNTYRNQLVLLTNVRVPRWLGIESVNNHVELHGFSDASNLAYAACVYVRTINVTGHIHVSLVAAKTKVAPIKQISIPRLELCGALLLSKLLVEVSENMNIPHDRVHAWTDSMVVLDWLKSHPSRWKTFVANRVSEILTNLSSVQWAHVSSKNNPADCASRGVPPQSLAENTLWFEGPNFLRETNVTYSRPNSLNEHLEESIKSHVTVNSEEMNLWSKYSTLRRLLRIVAYCRRFIYRKKNSDHTKYLKSTELNEALKCCIRNCQGTEFIEEILQIKKNGYVTAKASKIRSLCPYIDDEDIIRVGGRLEQADLPVQTKHSIILPHKTHFTNLIIADAHERTLHGGPQLMLNFLRSRYWIVGIKSLVKQYVRKCVVCVRNNARTRSQFMGELPAARCSPSRPFLNSGVDYAGPINIRTTKGRGYRSYKGYICVFVCMSTRAIHLEVASDMTTMAFLAAFRRFVSRRGHCAHIWSDNGTNFVGAAHELSELFKIQPSVAEYLESNGTEWHFIPPHAPNFGGLWEAAVKSTKFHLKRVIGESTLTYEEMSTLLCQIEACLNSRPMTVINTDEFNEPLPLTPGHFLVGEPLLAAPDLNYETTYISPLHRWQQVQRMVQNFWRRWSQEYLTTLLHRYKWGYKTPEPEIGEIVLIKESDLPPSRWLLGRIVQKHPGLDNITRVVTVRVKNTLLKRPTSKLCVLPVNE